ncbi:DUF3265 domain-containing protein [Vibrio parahaemolyticus]|nr:DUF3265 domain-containing protein [Vibrio parahaemolyticus]MBE4494593.1 DUF3265 domain-containing protein [Vibrio parahaemolyticus]MBE4503487.1 DUF3265 domain-containing protein [Vibrio parahaemolyticus]MBE4508096.1 DUF3265 domain-containing protein [Vibrio parahaemolyticus]
MIRHAWHFYYALVLVIKVLCGSIVLRASHLNWALVCCRKFGELNWYRYSKTYRVCGTNSR